MENLTELERAWRDRFKSRLVGKGIDPEIAADASKGAEVDFHESPEDAADAEFDYLVDEHRLYE